MFVSVLFVNFQRFSIPFFGGVKIPALFGDPPQLVIGGGFICGIPGYFFRFRQPQKQILGIFVIPHIPGILGQRLQNRPERQIHPDPLRFAHGKMKTCPKEMKLLPLFVQFLRSQRIGQASHHIHKGTGPGSSGGFGFGVHHICSQIPGQGRMQFVNILPPVVEQAHHGKGFPEPADFVSCPGFIHLPRHVFQIIHIHKPLVQPQRR